MAKHIRNGCIFMLVVSSSFLIFVTLVQFQNVTTGNNWFGHILELTENSTNLKLTHFTFQKKILFCTDDNILCRYSANEQPSYQEVKRPQLELKIEIPHLIKVQKSYSPQWDLEVHCQYCQYQIELSWNQNDEWRTKWSSWSPSSASSSAASTW